MSAERGEISPLMPKIHDTAIIGKDVIIGKSTSIGAYSIIADGVEIGENCVIDSCVKICAGVKMGNNNEVFHGAVLGEAPQSRGFDSRTKSGVVIGNKNIFREQSTVHRSLYENEATIIGNNNLIMANGHIAHDCIMGDHNVICNGVLLAGHIAVGDSSFISGNTVIHQFCRIGDFVMIGGGSRIVQDCPHYSLVVGAETGQVVSINGVGLRRAGFSLEDREAIKDAFKIIFWSHLPRSEIVKKLRGDSNKCVLRLAEFLEKSTRGICSGKGRKRAQRSLESNSISIS
jgi:UDP-N-acetylglucosamine acyltransferase